ncbi:extracellular solute-binding protein [Granulosicoccus sp.]|nr:extracellular solute-binding protein [Granulosicoccus sp.]MDB4223702.1 extracellular solute-binding protein [Granulosicoccus sp.]
MRYFFFLALGLCSLNVTAIDWEEQTFFNAQEGVQTLRVISSTDTSFFAPIIESFIAANPDVSIEYNVTGSVGVYDGFKTSPDEFDVVISSAMDLQFKLVNDGHALQIDDIEHPRWAQWRQSLFGFTLEPAAIVVNNQAFSGINIPQSRQEMIESLRAHPEKFRGKIATYDVRQSGLGYLFATQDARTSETYWRLMEVMGNLDTQLYCCSGDMIEDLAKGSIAISYNVLGSYATARSDLADKITIILPSDFPTTMMRTALVGKRTSHPDIAKSFLRHLTSSQWRDQGDEAFPTPSSQASANSAQRSTIALEPGLMIYLDRLKRQTFIEEWESAVIQ